jgi:hypothetical protein
MLAQLLYACYNYIRGYIDMAARAGSKSKVVYEYDWADGVEYEEHYKLTCINDAVRSALANIQRRIRAPHDLGRATSIQ